MVWHLKPWNPKSWSVCPTPFHLLEIRELSYIVVWYLKPKILKWWSHIVSLFRIQELLCIVVWYLKPRNPKIPKWWSHILSLFVIRELLCILVWYLKPQNPEILKPKISKWLSHILSPFGIQKLLCMVVWYLKPWNPETQNPEVWDPPSLFLHFGGLYVWLFGHLHSRNLELWIPEVLITFRELQSVDDWLLCSRKSELRNRILDGPLTFFVTLRFSVWCRVMFCIRS